MKEYEIYNPSGFCLPALKIRKRQYRENIEKDFTVNNLIKSKLLLNRDFNSLYLNIFTKSEEILDNLKYHEKKISFKDYLSKGFIDDINKYKIFNLFLESLKKQDCTLIITKKG